MASLQLTADQFLTAAKHRRTVYGLKSTSIVSDDRVTKIVEEVLSIAPSSYNTQPDRVTLVFGEKHKQFWDVVLQEAEKHFSAHAPDAWEGIKGFFGMHKGAYGTVVFWSSGKTIKESGVVHKNAAHMFPQYAEHATGMHQLLVWSALELEGVGANLQHVQAMPPVEAALKKFCGVPDDYQLKAQLTFGDESKEHPPKPEKLPFSETIKTL